MNFDFMSAYQGDAKKPPLGVMPESIWIEHRMYDLCRAIHEYRGHGTKLRREWMIELRQHLSHMIAQDNK